MFSVIFLMESKLQYFIFSYFALKVLLLESWPSSCNQHYHQMASCQSYSLLDELFSDTSYDDADGKQVVRNDSSPRVISKPRCNNFSFYSFLSDFVLQNGLAFHNQMDLDHPSVSLWQTMHFLLVHCFLLVTCNHQCPAIALIFQYLASTVNSNLPSCLERCQNFDCTFAKWYRNSFLLSY